MAKNISLYEHFFKLSVKMYKAIIVKLVNFM